MRATRDAAFNKVKIGDAERNVIARKQLRILGAGTDEYRRNGRRLQPRAEIAPGEWQDVSEDGRQVGLGEAYRQPGFGNAGLVPGRKWRGRRAAMRLMELSLA